MALIDPILAELEAEAATTRRVLERVPEGKLGWKPHAKSMSLGQLALHVATTPGQVAQMSTLESFEMRGFSQAEATSLREILDSHDQSVASARATLQGLTDARLMENWTASKNGAVVMQVPRIGFLRAILLNHGYHHRGQLTVYLRQLEVPLPPVYGPTADEDPFG